jgi:hypothetical protein
MPQMIDIQDLKIRTATAADERALIRLGQRDGQWPHPAPFLLGFAGDSLLAAISLADGRVIADPFERTDFLVDMLRTRAASLDRTESRDRPRRRRIRPRWAVA